MNPEGRADISTDAQRRCETKTVNKDINILLSSQSPLAFAFIETSQKNLFLKKLMLMLSNVIKQSIFVICRLVSPWQISVVPMLYFLLFGCSVISGHLHRFVRVLWSPLVTR